MEKIIKFILGVSPLNVDWKQTRNLFLVRCFAVCVVMSLVTGIIGLTQGASIGELLSNFFGLGIFGVIVFAPMVIIFMVVGRMFPPFAIVNLLLIIYFSFVDPIIWAIQKFQPNFFPTVILKPFNFRPILLVEKEVAADPSATS